jgi:hypothetical protein
MLHKDREDKKKSRLNLQTWKLQHHRWETLYEINSNLDIVKEEISELKDLIIENIQNKTDKKGINKWTGHECTVE